MTKYTKRYHSLERKEALANLYIMLFVFDCLVWIVVYNQLKG